MRVGRSYYRSAEFDAERARLKQSGVELEATSQFGIGILSCFMVADRVEVETYRVGHQPLKITIEGPTKYFVIKLLDEPPRSDFPTKPSSVNDDGPPHYPGTRVTIYLRRDVKVDVSQTLDTFSANIDFDTVIFQPGTNEPKVIPRRRWEDEEVQFNSLKEAVEAGYQNLWPIGGLRSRKVTTNLQVIVENLREVLAYSRIPFEKYDFSKNFRGNAWFWLLKGEDGRVSPQRGYLSIVRGLHLRGAPEALRHVTESLGVPLDSDEWRLFLQQLHTIVGNGQMPEPGTEADRIILNVFGFNLGRTEAFVKKKEFFDIWRMLPQRQQRLVVQSLETLNGAFVKNSDGSFDSVKK